MDEVRKALRETAAAVNQAINLGWELVFRRLAKSQGRDGEATILLCDSCGAVPSRFELEKAEGGVCVDCDNGEYIERSAPRKSVGLEHDVTPLRDDGEDSRDRLGPVRPVEPDADGRFDASRPGLDADPGFTRGTLDGRRIRSRYKHSGGRLDGAPIRSRAKRGGSGRLDDAPLRPRRKRSGRLL
jgi:hypothetical protein